jgi:hypothetical protein
MRSITSGGKHNRRFASFEYVYPLRNELTRIQPFSPDLMASSSSASCSSVSPFESGIQVLISRSSMNPLPWQSSHLTPPVPWQPQHTPQMTWPEPPHREQNDKKRFPSQVGQTPPPNRNTFAGICTPFPKRPNAKDQLPGRLQGLQGADNRNAGPVNCIRLFGLRHLPENELRTLRFPCSQKVRCPLTPLAQAEARAEEELRPDTRLSTGLRIFAG